MSFPSDSYRKAPDLRVREVPERETCLVYAPRQAELYRLNPSAWFIFRVCEGLTEGEIVRELQGAMEPMMSLQECALEVHTGLESLMKIGLIERVRGKSVRTRPPTRRIRDAQEN